MFEGWKRAWRQAVANFHHELSGGETTAEGAAHRRALRREIATARGVLAQLDREIARTLRQCEQEHVAEQDCRRREALARNVGDDETVRLALQYAERHAEHARVLQRKADVLGEERALLARDLDRMQQLAPAAAADAAAADTAAAADAAAADAAAAAAHTDAEFERMQREQQERTAAARLEELKRRMR